ncbi:MAG: MATE family efflux transporter [Rhizobiales bacterium PAR1]|nr:MAG: MATE family efflux transporter [Rhizobiales bacterium PAR1]
MTDPSRAAPPARFTQGSTMGHVITMTVTGAIGLMAIFVVDFLSLFYVSRLGNTELTAGVGYATTVLFLAISFNIGSMIAGTAMVSRQIGAGNRDIARRMAASVMSIASLLALAVSVLLMLFQPQVLDMLGATGTPKLVASRFLSITLPANFLMASGMMLSGLLRAVGDARRAMQVTLFGGLVTAGMDPLLIFGFGLGTDGAAIATVISRLVFTAVGLHGIIKVHKLLQMPKIADILGDARGFFGIAVPAILTNVATPVGGFLYMRVLAPFGTEAIAANAILDRLVPLAFGALFALSGAIGPILGQNLGARLFTRLRQAMRDAFIFATGYSLVAWFLLFLARNQIPSVFSVEGATAYYVVFFCDIGALAWIFIGFVLVANAAFNNLGFPLYSTAFNWGRATLGTVPLTMLGASMYGYEGAMIGLIVGSFLFGVAAVIVVFRAIGGLEAQVDTAAKTA